MTKINPIKLLKEGKIGVLATDTIYGIHGLALNKKVVERLYEVRERDPKKPFIILISAVDDLELFKISVSKKTKAILEKIWPNKISVVLACIDPDLHYLHRGTDSLAFRLPKNKIIAGIIKETGPLISTSVNPPGLTPAYDISQAIKYFGDKLDFYIDSGRVESKPSTLIKIDKRGKVEILRQGEVPIDISFLG